MKKLLITLVAVMIAFPCFAGTSEMYDGFLVIDTTNDDFTVNGAIIATGDMTVDDITATGNIVGDGTGEISGMRTDIEVGVTTDTLTAIESGRVNVVTTTSTKTLPTAATGLQYQFVDGTGCTITIDTGVTTDTIEYLALDAGDTIDSPGATGDSVTLIGDGTNHKWYVVNMKGTWTDGGAT
jgi:hypothetical protein